MIESSIKSCQSKGQPTNKISLSLEELSHCNEGCVGKNPLLQWLFLEWFYPKLAQFIPKPTELLREMQYPQLDAVLLSASLFSGALRGVGLTWIMGLIISLQPGCTCTGARALERGLGQEPSTVSAGKSLAVPSSGYSAAWGHSRDQKVAPPRMQQHITLGSTSTGTSRAFQG